MTGIYQRTDGPYSYWVTYPLSRWFDGFVTVYMP
jgi:hypothetical protein